MIDTTVRYARCETPQPYWRSFVNAAGSSAAPAMRTSTPDVPHGIHDERWRAGCHGNRARPVRRGAVGKGPGHLAPRRRPTLRPALFGKGPMEKDPRQGHLASGLLHSEARAGETDRPKGRHRAPARPYGLSLTPCVRSTWAPRGHTPILHHRVGWKRALMAPGLGYRPNGQPTSGSDPPPNPRPILAERAGGIFTANSRMSRWPTCGSANIFISRYHTPGLKASSLLSARCRGITGLK